MKFSFSVIASFGTFSTWPCGATFVDVGKGLFRATFMEVGKGLFRASILITGGLDSFELFIERSLQESKEGDLSIIDADGIAVKSRALMKELSSVLFTGVKQML